MPRNIKRTKKNTWSTFARGLKLAKHISKNNVWFAHVNNNKTAFCEIRRINHGDIQNNQDDINDANAVVYVPKEEKNQFFLYIIFSTIDTNGKEWVFKSHTFSKDDGTLLPESVRASAYGTMMCKC